MLEAAEVPLSPPRTVFMVFVSSSLLKSWIFISVAPKVNRLDGGGRLAGEREREQREVGVAAELDVRDSRILRAVDVDVAVRRAARQDAHRYGQVHGLTDGVGGRIAVVAAAHRLHGLRVEFFAQVLDLHFSIS